ncbi:MAG TPA: ABC transporter ATP-binding protein [Bacteroidales bacterium]|nr:ABC transporter ATP-binding protein [Bacteroidales bacterium]
MAKRVKGESIDKEHKESIFSLLKPYRKMVILLIFFALLGNTFNLFIPKIISSAIDSFSAHSIDFNRTMIYFIIATVFIFLFSYFQSLMQTYVSEKAARDIRTQITDKISKQSYSFIIEANPSKILTNLTADVDSIKLFISQAVVSMFSSAFIIIGASVLLISINWQLALCVMAIIPLIGGAFYLVLRKIRVLFKKSREVIDWLNKVINESILGAAIIRVLNSQQAENSKFIAASGASRDLGFLILNLFASLIPVISFVSNMALLTILVLGGHFVITEKMTIGEFAAFNSYIAILIFPIIIIGFMSNIIAQASASYQRIQQILMAPEPEDRGNLEGFSKGNILIKNVSVNYGEKPALKDISINIPVGSKTAIIGPTAAGKTQLLYLLTGLIKPDSGSIEIDGQLIDNYKSDFFHKQIGFVFQDSVIFNLSLLENIAFNDAVTKEALDKAIETAELKSYISTLPEGMETLISERGTSLSGGQKQRIMLARALALEPSVLLLDDFTARVDRRTEKKIMENLLRNYPGITLISVTQKISAVEDYDQIILLMESEIIARGTHDELMRSSPEYVQIYNSQRSTSHYDVQS